MDRETFALEINRLKSVYGERFYPTERIAMMYEHLQDTVPFHLSKAISRVICEQMNPPTLSKIKETLTLVRQEYQIEDPNDKIRERLNAGRINNCPLCFAYGLVQIRKKSEGGRYSYLRICNCEAGDEAARLPENNRHLRRYAIEPDIMIRSDKLWDRPFAEWQKIWREEKAKAERETP